MNDDEKQTPGVEQGSQSPAVIRTCFSCVICELNAVRTCCDSGFCDGHYAMHVEVAARFHHGIASELLRVARMALQQFEFTYGKRKRGWDAAFLMAELQTAITNAEVQPRTPTGE